MAKTNPRLLRRIRHRRVRNKVVGTTMRPRLCVFRSSRHFYAQVIDDSLGQTLASASTLDAEIRGKTKQTRKTEEAKLVGSLLARRTLDKGISSVVFDRGGYKYHGRVKAFAETSKQVGLSF